MKKVIYSFLLMFLLIPACYVDDLNDWEPPEYNPISFETVSQPYLDKYGQPEDVYEYDSSCYHTIDWWWWSQGFEVTFIDTCYDDIDGWAVDSEYSFPPI